jgi:hypothetical protein
MHSVENEAELDGVSVSLVQQQTSHTSFNVHPLRFLEVTLVAAYVNAVTGACSTRFLAKTEGSPEFT